MCVPACLARKTRSDESAGQGKHRPPSAAPSPTWRHRELAASSPVRGLHCWRRAQQEVLEDWRGRATTAAGDTWERSELGELGKGLETLAMSWFLLRQPNLSLAITYLFCLGWHTLCVSKYHLLSTLYFRQRTRCLTKRARFRIVVRLLRARLWSQIT